MIPCILSPPHHHFQETSEDKSPPDILLSSFWVSQPFPQACPQGVTGPERTVSAMRNPPQQKMERLTDISQHFRAGRQACRGEMRYERSLVSPGEVLPARHCLLFFSVFELSSSLPWRGRGKIVLSTPAHCWKGLCLQRGGTDRDQEFGSAVTSFIRQRGNISDLCHKTTVINQS